MKITKRNKETLKEELVKYLNQFSRTDWLAWKEVIGFQRRQGLSWAQTRQLLKYLESEGRVQIDYVPISPFASYLIFRLKCGVLESVPPQG